MKTVKYMRFQIRDNRTVFLAYCIVYVVLLVLAFSMSLTGDGQTQYDYYVMCKYIARTCILILGTIPMLVLSSEIIERNQRPHIIIYRFRWNVFSTLSCVGFSLVLPCVYWMLFNIIFRKSIAYVNSVVPHTWVHSGIEILEYLVIVFVLASLAFVIGMVSKSVTIALMLTLFYTLIVEFFSFDMFGRELNWLRVTNVTNSVGPGWWHWTLYWAVLGGIFLAIGLILVKKSLKKL